MRATRCRLTLPLYHPAPSPTSLLNLPDELLTAIFDQVYRSQRPFEEDEDAEFGLLVPLEQILVNKRILRLARPIWFHHLTAPSGLLGDTFLSKLSARHHDHHLVQSLFTEHPYTFPSLHSSVLALLSNLTSLSLFFPVLADPSATTYTIPFAVTRAVKSLPRLEHLKLTGKPQLAFEDTSFCLDRDLPTLRHLDADETLSQAVLSYSATTLRALTVRGKQHPFSSLPWATLVSLRLLADGKFRAGPHGQLVDTLRTLKGRPISPPSTAPSVLPFLRADPCQCRSAYDASSWERIVSTLRPPVILTTSSWRNFLSSCSIPHWTASKSTAGVT